MNDAVKTGPLVTNIDDAAIDDTRWPAFMDTIAPSLSVGVTINIGLQNLGDNGAASEPDGATNASPSGLDPASAT